MKKKGFFSTFCKAFFLLIFLFFAFLFALLFRASFPSGTFSVSSPFSVTPLSSSEESAPLRRLTGRDEETRAIWIATVYNINYPSRASLSASSLEKEMTAMLDRICEYGFNTVFFQARPSSDALYDSAIFPVSAWLTGEEGSPLPGGFDPLGRLVKEAHKRGIFVYAWVNPLRVTVGSSAFPSLDLSALSPANPARLHPEWTVAYDGQIFYNAGLPQARELVAEGVREIVKNYDVDGVVFDDYFYPYPVGNEVFHDEEAFALYGNGLPLDDWRRGNVNKLIAACYAAVKEEYASCRFGVAPFGVWKNDDGRNGGSKTNGLQAYSAIYCDAIAWLEQGSVDFLAPQIYWPFSGPAVPFGELVDWWDGRMKDYPSVDLIISHALYLAPGWEKGELSSQVSYAREKRSYCGSTFYGYAALSQGGEELKKEFSSLFSGVLYPRLSPRSSS